MIEVQRSVPAPGGRPERIVTVHRHHHGRDFRATAADGWVEAAALALRDGHFGTP